MTTTVAVELLRQGILVGLTIALPPLVAVLIVGLIIGILQAATGIQEITLTFVPKLLIVFALALLFGAAGIALLTDFATKMLTMIPEVVR